MYKADDLLYQSQDSTTRFKEVEHQKSEAVSEIIYRVFFYNLRYVEFDYALNLKNIFLQNSENSVLYFS